MVADRALVNGKGEPPSPIHSAFSTGVQLLHAGRASLLLRHATEPVLIVAACVGIESSVVPSIRVPIGHGIAGIVVERGISLFGAKGDQTFMSSPVSTERGIEGALNLTDRLDGRQYSADDIASVTSIATHIGHLIQYSRHAAQDLVSGLPNRRAFEEVLEREIALSRRTGNPFTVVFIDLDNLKQINDTYGHTKGDEVIHKVGEALQRILRPYDFAGRHGGDEFALLLSGAGESDGNITARIASAVAGMAETLHVPMSVSVGVSRCPTDGTQASQLVATADTRMYEHKRTKHVQRQQTMNPSAS